MIRQGVTFAILALLTTLCYAEHPSLPSSFQSKSLEGADIYVPWAGRASVVVLIHEYAEKSELLGAISSST
jgi:hypothetical protein